MTYLPTGYLALARAVADVPSPASFRALAGNGVRTILVESAPHGRHPLGGRGQAPRLASARLIASDAGASSFDVSGASTAGPVTPGG